MPGAMTAPTDVPARLHVPRPWLHSARAPQPCRRSRRLSACWRCARGHCARVSPRAPLIHAASSCLGLCAARTGRPGDQRRQGLQPNPGWHRGGGRESHGRFDGLPCRRGRRARSLPACLLDRSKAAADRCSGQCPLVLVGQTCPTRSRWPERFWNRPNATTSHYDGFHRCMPPNHQHKSMSATNANVLRVEFLTRAHPSTPPPHPTGC